MPSNQVSRIASIGLRAGTAALSAMLLAACATSYPPAPVSVATAEMNYLIGPMDSLSIIVWRNPDLSSQVHVRPDGRISTPLVDDIPAAGRTPAELSREIEKALGKLIRDPVVTVIVSGFQGTNGQQVRVIGEAARPQSIPFRHGMSLLDVMIQVGGLTDFADGNHAVLVRATNGATGNAQYTVRLKDLVKRGDISANVAVGPGDILIIPQSWF